MATHRPNIGAYITRFNGRMGTFKRGVLLKLFGAVIKDTPVLTGRLRGNWTFSKGEPPSSFTEGTDDPSQQIFGQIMAEVDQKDGKYYIANSMAYCNRIEYEGWSHTKAPQGMVRKNIVRIAKILAEEAKKR